MIVGVRAIEAQKREAGWLRYNMYMPGRSVYYHAGCPPTMVIFDFQRGMVYYLKAYGLVEAHKFVAFRCNEHANIVHVDVQAQPVWSNTKLRRCQWRQILRVAQYIPLQMPREWVLSYYRRNCAN